MVRNPPDCGRLRTATGTLARKPRAGPSGLPGVVDRDIGLISSARQASDVLDEVAQRLGLVKQVRGVPLDQGFLIVSHRTRASQNQNGSCPVPGVHPQHGEQLEAVLRTEVKVQDDCAERVIVREGHGFRDRARLDGLVPIEAERTGEHPADPRVVVHDQDVAIPDGRISRRRIGRVTPLHAYVHYKGWAMGPNAPGCHMVHVEVPAYTSGT